MLGLFASDFFSRSPLLVFPLIGLAIFMTVFVFVSLRAAFLARSEVERLSHLPFEEDDHG